MQRSKRIIVVSHCILNQNTVIADEARALGAIPSVVNWMNDQGFGIVQLPCPEFTFLGLDRPSMTYEEYNTPAYREHSRSILAPLIQQLIMYHNAGYELCGLVGIASSPSCDPSRGIFMEEFFLGLKERGIILKESWYLPDIAEPIFDAEQHKL